MMNKETMVVNAIRILSAEAVQKAKSGHPGMPMGAAAMAYAVWGREMKHNPADDKWADRDRFVLSSGHGSMLLYSLLHLFGYGLTIEDLKQFRQFGSKTPGHPEYGHTRGVETSTARWAWASPTPSAWRWPRAIWPRSSTARVSRSSTIIPTSFWATAA